MQRRIPSGTGLCEERQQVKAEAIRGADRRQAVTLPATVGGMGLEPYLPVGVGFDALNELDDVSWSRLRHAYGQGVVGTDLYGDVARSLTLLREDSRSALNEGLWSSLCHQGTVYEASAFALPFLASVASGSVPAELRTSLTVLIGCIAIGGSEVSPSGTQQGSYGEGVDVLVRETISRCEGYLSSIARLDPSLAPLVAAIQLVTAYPSHANREAAMQLIDPEE